MPQESKKRWAQLRVGLMAIVALALLATMIFLLTSTNGLFQSYSQVYTYLDDSAAIGEGAPVRVNGINAGRVRRVELSGSNEPNRVVRVVMEVDNEYMPSIPVDSQAQIAAENLLGTKYINIKRGRAAATIAKGQEIRSLDTREFDDIVQQGYSTLASLDGILKKLDGIMTQVQVGQGTIGHLLSDNTLYNQLLGITIEAQKVVATLNSDQGTLGRLMHDDSLYTGVQETLGRVNTLADSLNKGEGTAGKLLKDPLLYDDARAAIGDVRKLLATIDQSNGTFNKLLKTDEAHARLLGTMARLDTVLDKINGGQGTLGQLLVNPSLYQSLDLTAAEMHGLMKDFRSNPKKFLRIKLAIF